MERTERIEIRLSPAEKLRLIQLARRQRISVSALIRTLIQEEDSK